MINKAKETAKNINETVIHEAAQDRGDSAELHPDDLPVDLDTLFEVEDDKKEKGMIKKEKIGFFGKIKRFFSDIKGKYNHGKEENDIFEVNDDLDKTSENEPSVNTGEYTKAGFSVMRKIKDILSSKIESKSYREVSIADIRNVAGRVAEFGKDEYTSSRCKSIVRRLVDFADQKFYEAGVVERGIRAVRNSAMQSKDLGR